MEEVHSGTAAAHSFRVRADGGCRRCVHAPRRGLARSHGAYEAPQPFVVNLGRYQWPQLRHIHAPAIRVDHTLPRRRVTVQRFSVTAKQTHPAQVRKPRVSVSAQPLAHVLWYATHRRANGADSQPVSSTTARATSLTEFFDAGAGFDDAEDAFIMHAAGGDVRGKSETLEGLFEMAERRMAETAAAQRVGDSVDDEWLAR
ncbi:hypothetical protein FGB62_42g12 [Gracilaria domingensis]|nr:hypothetical protein FGB62_42g12 [Gracilaria domingensis]